MAVAAEVITATAAANPIAIAARVATTSTRSTTTITTTTTSINPVLDNSIESVKSATFTNLFILVALLVAFDFLVSWPKARRFLLPRFQDGDDLPRFPFGWARQAWQGPDAQMQGQNPDATVFIRFCQLGFKFCCFGSLLDLVLLPMYFNGHGDAAGFNVFSLSNLTGESDKIWGVVAAAYILTGYLLHLLLSEWKYFVALQREHFVLSCRGSCGAATAQARHSIIVELIPPAARSNEAIRKFFESVFGPDSVASCVLLDDTSEFYRHQDLRTATRTCRCCKPRALEHAVNRVADGAAGLLQADIAGQAGQTSHVPPTIVTPENSLGRSAPVNAVQELGQGVRQFGVGMLQIGQELIVGSSVSSTAFVTLHKVAHCASAEQMLLIHGGAWDVRAAPEPRDMIWRNAPKSLSQIQFRTLVSNIWTTVGVLFWAFPVLGVQAFAQASSLKKNFPNTIKFLEKTPVYGQITGYLPAMALIGLQAVLPFLFELIAKKYEGVKTKSQVQRSLFNRCFAYQLASLYVTVIGGSLITSLNSIIDHPANAPSILTDSLPKVAVYFTTFVLARVGTSLPLLLLRPAAAFGDGPQCCSFGGELANVSLVLVIGLTYSFTSPAILPPCMLFFGLASLIYRWLFAYVYEPEFDFGGQLWYDLFRCVIIGLFLGSLALVSIIGSKGQAIQSSALVPLPLCIVGFACYCWWGKLGAQASQVALVDAMAADQIDPEISAFADPFYFDPAPLELSSSIVTQQHDCEDAPASGANSPADRLVVQNSGAASSQGMPLSLSYDAAVGGSTHASSDAADNKARWTTAASWETAKSESLGLEAGEPKSKFAD